VAEAGPFAAMLFAPGSLALGPGSSASVAAILGQQAAWLALTIVAALLVDRDGADPVFNTVDFYRRGTQRQLRQLEAALEHHLSGGLGAPGGEHAAARVVRMLGIHAGVDDRVESAIQLRGIVIREHDRGEDREHGDDRGRGGGRCDRHPGTQ